MSHYCLTKHNFITYYIHNILWHVICQHRSLEKNKKNSSVGASSHSRFSDIPKYPEDAILGVTLPYNADPNADKVNIGVGAYRDDAGFTSVLSAVHQAEERLLSRSLDMEYLPVAGNSFLLVSRNVEMTFQGVLPSEYSDAVFTCAGTRFCQTYSGDCLKKGGRRCQRLHT